MTAPRQHLSHGLDVPYIVRWTDNGTDDLTATIERADTDFQNTWADEPQTITIPRVLVDDLGDVEAINQMLDQLAPAPTGTVALASSLAA